MVGERLLRVPVLATRRRVGVDLRRDRVDRGLDLGELLLDVVGGSLRTVLVDPVGRLLEGGVLLVGLLRALGDVCTSVSTPSNGKLQAWGSAAEEGT